MRVFVSVLWFFCCAMRLAAQAPSPSIVNVKAPAVFRVMFKTTRGNFIMEARREWSPLGVDRLYQLVTSGYYDNSLIFRAEPGFVVQFGIAEKQDVKLFWNKKYIQDEPVLQKHRKGMVAFARDVKNSRSTQLFIDMADNPKLDTTVRYGVQGFTPIAKVISGMDVIAKFFSRYGKEPATNQVELYRKGNAYYEQKYPGLDKILSAKIIRYNE